MRLLNPMGRPWTPGQVLGALLYTIFIAASTWATAESVARTTGLPKAFCYVVALAVMLGASFCLSLIKWSIASGYVDRRALKLAVGMTGFLFLWLVSLTSNTHNFYYVSVVEDLREREVKQALSALTLLNATSETASKKAVADFRSQVEALIERMKSEILNPGDPGAGPQTELVLSQIERLLGTELQRLDPPSHSSAGRRRFADAMAIHIRDAMSARLQPVEESSSEVRRYFTTPRYRSALEKLDAIDTQGTSSLQTDELKAALRSTYETYNQALRFVNATFRLPILQRVPLDLEPLPEVPRSIALENIATAWRDFLAGRFEPYKFWLSLLWAVALDFAAFVVFYFGVLPREEEY